jgi:hypothetical protein
MGTFEQARSINTRFTSVGRAVKARVGSREGNFIDLWVEVPVHLTAYEPPTDNTSQVTHLRSGQPQSRTCLSWGGPTYTGSAFSSWCADYIGTVNGSWDDVLELRHTSELASPAGTSQRWPTVRCRFHAHQVEQRFSLKRILVTAVAAANQPTSSCAILAIGGYSGGIAAGYHSLLDSNDINERPRTAANGEETRQIAVVHEMGHYIGLHHRCRAERQPVGYTPGDASAPMSNPRFGDIQSGQGDAYCESAPEGALTQDRMAAGMVLRPWHAYVWRQIWESLGRTPDGIEIPRRGWVPRVKPES